MGRWLQWIEDKLGGGPGGTKRVQSLRWLLLIGLFGMMLMILNSFIQVRQVDPTEQSRASPEPLEDVFAGSTKEPSPFESYEQAYEESLKQILEHIVGVGQVDVLVTLESTEEIVVYRDTQDTQKVTEERDTNGATRHITDVSRSGKLVLYEVSGDPQPIVLKQIKPKIRGVVVVAGGAENLTVSKLIKDTVSMGLDVPAHRIFVAPRKQN